MNKTTQELRLRFDNKEKQQLRERIVNNYIIKPNKLCEKPSPKCFTILDFWGGGLFPDYVISRIKEIKRKIILYEIDNNKKLWPDLIQYAKDKNQNMSVKNQTVVVKPFCGSLANFIQHQQKHVKNHGCHVDLIWLDYCGTIKQDDLEAIKSIVGPKTVIVLTGFLISPNSKHKNITLDQQKSWVKEKMNSIHPSLSLIKVIRYKACMATYIFKQKYEKKDKPTFYEASPLNNRPCYASVKVFRQGNNQIPSYR